MKDTMIGPMGFHDILQVDFYLWYEDFELHQTIDRCLWSNLIFLGGKEEEVICFWFSVCVFV